MKTANNSEEKKKLNSVLLFIGFVLFAILGMVFLWGQVQEKGTTAVVTMDGEIRYTCSLFMEKEIDIDGINKLVIKDGMADMVFADCPDQVCVKHEPISKIGESIICLPNKVVVTIEGLNRNGKPVRGEADVIVR